MNHHQALRMVVFHCTVVLHDRNQLICSFHGYSSFICSYSYSTLLSYFSFFLFIHSLLYYTQLILNQVDQIRPKFQVIIA